MDINKRHKIDGTAVPIVGNDIDTDRIIPARYLKEITFENMGNYLFHDVRFDEDNQQKPHPLNEDKFKGAKLMIVERNFGCGSSREHAPQAILRFGIQAIIGVSFAEIFASNCKNLGVPTVIASEADIEKLRLISDQQPNTHFSLDLDSETVSFDNQTVSISIPKSQKNAFIAGTWNTASLLEENMDKIKETASQLPYLNW
ncbi:MAG: 3-isopropylmalate/(R)-2-methylmalate dehydratase small subunit [Candidatus Marinamargulisbacteria bacterium]|jgi:3-isopropylmalate/(R)-2-methylmalate dehydratase small subunit